MVHDPHEIAPDDILDDLELISGEEPFPHPSGEYPQPTPVYTEDPIGLEEHTLFEESTEEAQLTPNQIDLGNVL